MARESKIFISHRFADKAIADVVRQNLGIWGFDTAIFQASAPGLGPKAGENITDELKAALCNSKLVILLFTLTDYDWAYCMWECGLATHPTRADTRTVVIQCNPLDVPKTFEGQLLVKVEKESIKDFTIQFHREDNFFPGEPPFRPDITEEIIEKYSTDLYNDLCAVIPPGQREERSRWDYLILNLTKADGEKIIKESPEVAGTSILNNCGIVKVFGAALQHFGYVNLEPELTFSDLVDRWTKRTKARRDVPTEWIKELTAEIYRALENSPANPEWKSLESVAFPEIHYYPVVNHARVLPDGSMEFDVYFYRSLRKSKALIVEKQVEEQRAKKG